MGHDSNNKIQYTLSNGLATITQQCNEMSSVADYTLALVVRTLYCQYTHATIFAQRRKEMSLVALLCRQQYNVSLAVTVMVSTYATRCHWSRGCSCNDETR